MSEEMVRVELVLVLLAVQFILSIRWAMITAIVSGSVVMTAGAAFEEGYAILSGLAMPVVTSIWIMLFRGLPPRPSWAHPTAKWLLIIGAFLLAVIIGLVSFWYLGLFILVAFVAMAIRFGVSSRRATNATVIGTIGSAMRQNLPLADALDSAGKGGVDKASEVMRRVAELLRKGMPVSEALRTAYKACDGHAVSFISSAERTSQLPAALECIQADLAKQAKDARRPTFVHPFYPVLLMVLVVLIVMSLGVFVIPSFKEIYAGIGEKLPRSTQVLFDMNQMPFSPLGIIIPLALALGVIAIWVHCRPRRPSRPHWLSLVGDFFKWHLPFFRGFERDRSLLRVVESLRLSLRAGHTINEAILNAFDLDVNTCFRLRLMDWHRMVVRGQDVSAAARRCGLGRALAWAFDQQVNPAAAPQTLEMLETFYRANYRYRLNVARGVLCPLVVLAIAAMVGFVVYSCFAPYVMLIEMTVNTILS